MILAPYFRRIVIGLVVTAFVVGLIGFSAPIASAQEGGPRTITDFMGNQVTIQNPPQHVIGMSASINEMLFAIGVTPAGVTDAMDYPPAAASLPTFGSGYQPDLEALAALSPDLIIADGQLDMSIMDKLGTIAPTFAVMTLTASDIPKNIQLLGQATWHDTQAEYVSKSYDDFLALSDALGQASQGPSILIIVGTLQQPNYGKSSTYLGDMAKRLGATNIADGEADQGPFPGYTQLSSEAILAADPEVILTVTRGSDTPMPDTMKTDPVWSTLSAVKNGKVYEMDSRLFLESPGPRFVDAMLQLYQLLYGEGM
jgi:iron complex transport system substrate-binding protein